MSFPIFAKKATPIPTDPTKYVEGIAYTITPQSAEDIKKELAPGLSSRVIVDTSVLNYTLNVTTNIIATVKTHGVLFASEMQGENSLFVVAAKSGNYYSLACKHNGEVFEYFEPATDKKNGWVDIAELYNSSRNIFDLMPKASTTTSGAIVKADAVTPQEFKSARVTRWQWEEAAYTISSLTIGANYGRATRYLFDGAPCCVSITGLPHDGQLLSKVTYTNGKEIPELDTAHGFDFIIYGQAIC